MSTDGFQITSSSDRYGHRIELAGELTEAAVPRLADCLDRALEDDPGRILVDLRGLTALHPAAVVALLAAHIRASDDHCELVLIRGPVSVQQVIDSMDGPFRYAPTP